MGFADDLAFVYYSSNTFDLVSDISHDLDILRFVFFVVVLR